MARRRKISTIRWNIRLKIYRLTLELAKGETNMEKILQYYDSYDEDGRLTRDNAHKVEFITTTHILDSVIPENCKILDLGAGAGRYTFYYAEKGHAVTAIDLSSHNVQIMEDNMAKSSTKPHVEIYQGDARNLDFLTRESFDVVLCMGPIYHLKSAEERIACIKGCLAKLKSGGILAIAYINKVAVCLSEIRRGNKEFLQGESITHILTSGAEFGDERDCFYFTSSGEIDGIMRDFEVDSLANAATDGFAYLMPDMINSFTAEEYQAWLNFHLRTCCDPTIVGAGLHGLFVGKKR